MAVEETRTNVIYGALAVAAAALLFGGLCWAAVLRPVDELLYDLLLRFRAHDRQGEAVGSDIVLVTIDEESMAALQHRWPWPRSWQAELVRKLDASGARAIGIDLLLIDPAEDRAEDERLRAALAATDKVVLAAKFESLQRSLPKAGVYAEGTRLVLPCSVFRDVARSGIINHAFGSGSTIRDYRSHYTFMDAEYPAFATEVYRVAYGREPARTAGGIDYLGGRGTFPSVPAYQVLQDTAPGGSFAHKLCLVGVTFAEAHDLFATPVATANEPCPGVEVHANVLAGLIRGEFCRPLPRPAQAFVAMLLVGVIGYLTLFRPTGLLLAVSGGTIVLVVVANLLLMRGAGTWFDLTYALGALPVGFIAASLPTRRVLVLNTKVGPYVLLEELGRGGMAIVYRARHPKTREEVALKRLIAELANEETLQRFLREIEMIRDLDHPNIVHVVDAGEVDGEPYYAMEYIRGPTLDNVLREQGRIAPGDVRRIGGAVARALARAHEIGVIHRDVKPSNIMLTPTGTPKLTDFGIAKRLDSPQLTRTGEVMGTPFYMAPEQLSGEPPAPATDVYNLGATLFHLLTGRPPFVADTPEAITAMILHKAAPDPRLLCADVDSELADLIQVSLCKRPDERPVDMQTVATRLDPYYTRSQERARPRPAATLENGTQATRQCFDTQVADAGDVPDAPPHTVRIVLPPEGEE